MAGSISASHLACIAISQGPDRCPKHVDISKKSLTNWPRDLWRRIMASIPMLSRAVDDTPRRDGLEHRTPGPTAPFFLDDHLDPD
jgi:hypothetical protein